MRDNAFLFIKNSFFVSLSSVTTKQCASVFARRARKEAQASKTDAQILWTRGSRGYGTRSPVRVCCASACYPKSTSVSTAYTPATMGFNLVSCFCDERLLRVSAKRAWSRKRLRTSRATQPCCYARA